MSCSSTVARNEPRRFCRLIIFAKGAISFLCDTTSSSFFFFAVAIPSDCIQVGHKNNHELCASDRGNGTKKEKKRVAQILGLLYTHNGTKKCCNLSNQACIKEFNKRDRFVFVSLPLRAKCLFSLSFRSLLSPFFTICTISNI